MTDFTADRLQFTFNPPLQENDRRAITNGMGRHWPLCEHLVAVMLAHTGRGLALPENVTLTAMSIKFRDGTSAYVEVEYVDNNKGIVQYKTIPLPILRG